MLKPGEKHFKRRESRCKGPEAKCAWHSPRTARRPVWESRVSERESVVRWRERGARVRGGGWGGGGGADLERLLGHSNCLGIPGRVLSYSDQVKYQAPNYI